MAKKVRVYELARELGLDNAETLALCESLGIGVKSASSSMEEAHADRARLQAARELGAQVTMLAPVYFIAEL